MSSIKAAKLGVILWAHAFSILKNALLRWEVIVHTNLYAPLQENSQDGLF